jgi:hypothetical protein
VHRLEALFAALEQNADQIDQNVGAQGRAFD